MLGSVYDSHADEDVYTEIVLDEEILDVGEVRGVPVYKDHAGMWRAELGCEGELHEALEVS